MPRKNTTAAMRFAMARILVHIEVVSNDEASPVKVAHLPVQFVLVRVKRMKDQKTGPRSRRNLAELTHALRTYFMDQHVATVALLDDRFARNRIAPDHDGAVGGLQPIAPADAVTVIL